MPIHFLDTFNRANGAPGNGWSVTAGTTVNLVIQNNALTLDSDGTDAGIFRSIDTTLPLAAAAFITPETDAAGIQGHYDTTFLFGNDGTLTGGWGVEFLRSNQNNNDSRVALLHDGAVVATQFSPFQFTTFDTITQQGDISVTVNIGADGTVSGTVHGFALGLFNFNFGQQTINFTGSDFALIQAPPGDSGLGTNATIDNLELTQGSGLVPTLIVKPSATFTEDAGPVVLSPNPGTDTQIFDFNSFLLSHASVHIVDAQPGDVLDAAFLPISAGIGFSYDATTHTLNFYARDTLANYIHELSTVTFENTGDNPDVFGAHPTRTLQWQITDTLVPSGPLFAPVQNYDVGTGPTSAIALDFEGNPFLPLDLNGDGIRDIVMATPGSGEISILRGNGDGTFVLASSLDVGGSPGSVDAGDYNADGLIDLAYVDQNTGKVSVLLATNIGGVPGFASPATVATVPGATFVRDALIHTAAPDDQETLAVAAPGGVHLYFSDFNANFTTGPILAAGTPSFVMSADFGGPKVGLVGENDFAIADTATDSILIYLDDSGTFTLSSTILEPLGSNPQGIAVGSNLRNATGGANDLVVANAGADNISLFFGNGDGTFTAPTVLALKAGAHPVSVTLTDVNGDGNLDIVAADQGSNDMAILLANVDSNGVRDGTFQAPFYLDAGTGPSSIVSGDLDLDGNPDLVVTNAGSNNVSVFMHSATTASDIVTTTVNVAAVDDAPVNTHPASITVHQDTPRALAPLSVADPDAQTMTLTLSVTHGTIHVRNDLGLLDGTNITGNGSSSVVLHSDLALLNATLGAANGVVYTPDSGFVGSATLTMVSNDGGETGSGGPQSDSDPNIPINVAASLQFINLDNTPTFTENGAFVTLDNNAVIQGAITFDGATLTLQRDGGANPDDFFASSFLTPDGDVDMGGGNVVGSYFLSGGMLHITFNNLATETNVDSVLQSLKYADFNNNPPSSAQIDYSFNDTIGTVNGDIVVTIIPVNDPPTIDGVSAAGIYAAGSPPVILSPGVLLSDPDSANLTVATVHITNGFGGDTLSANAGATGIGVAYDSGTFTLTLSGAHTLAQYQQVLDTVGYSSADTDPTNGASHPTRSISWQVGDTGITPDSNVQTTLLQYAPFLDLDQSGAGTGFTGHFTENGTHVAVADTDDFIFTSNGSIASATITLTDAHAGDDLSYDNSVGGITGSKDTSTPGKIVVSLTSEGLSPSSFQTALQHVFFSNPSDNPDPSDRHINVVITDAVTTSNTAVDVISVTPVNDPPVAQNGTFSTHVNHAVSGNAVATDPDNTPDQLSYSLVGPNGGAYGAVAMNPDGSFTYTPAADFAGPDSFHFTATDPAPATSNTATISVTVTNDRPVLSNVSPTAFFTLGSSGVVLSPGLHATDDSTLKDAIVQITDGYLLGDKLVVNLTTDGGGHFIVNEGGPVVTNITVQYNALGKLVLAGADTPQHYQEVLDAVAYTSTAADPTNAGHDAHRTVSWQVNDGTVTYVVSDSILTPSPLLQTPAPTYTAGSTPLRVEAADLNGDGVLDLITTNDGSGNVSVLLGSGNGSFGAPNNFPVGTNPVDFAVGDLNGDSVPDLAVANTGGTVSVLLGNGAGGFGAQTPFNAGANPESVAIADFNNDGHPDLVVANRTTPTVSVLLGTGPGSFASPVSVPTGASGPVDVVDVVTGDFNGDGKPDIAASNFSSGNVAILLGNGSGGFGAATTFTTGGAAHGLATGDLNGDGILDLAVATDSAGVAVLLGNGSGGFGAPTTFTAGATTVNVTIGDVNADGKLDLIASNQTSNNVSVLLGNGNGTFASAANFAVQSQPNGIATGDFNGDGALDVVAANGGSNNVSVLLNNGTNASNVPQTLVSMNRAPLAQNGSASGNEDTAITGNASGSDPDSDPITFALVGANGGAAHGTVSLNTDGSFTYTPAANFNGGDSFSFNVTDNHSATSNSATISITVNPVNDAPVAQNGSASGNEDNPITGSASATDVDNDPLSFALVGANGGAAHGTVSLNSNGSFTYTPAPNFNGPDSFNFNATDNHAATSNTATISITVNPVNDAPVAQNGSASGNEDNPINGTLVATDIDSPSLTYSRVTNAAHGNVVVNANGTFSYTPNQDFNGTDGFTFKANDGSADSNTASVSLTVSPVDDAPVFAGIGGAAHTQATEQTFVRIDGAVTVSDVELDARNGGAGDYKGANLIIGRAGSPNPNPEDTFSFASGSAQFTVDNNLHALLFNGNQFATFNIPTSGAQAGTIAVNFNSLNTTATTALVNDVMQHITYENQSDTPPASVTLHWTFNDGNFDNSQGSGGNKFDTANRVVDITPVDDAPVAQNGSASGNEDNVISGMLVASDVDSASLAFSRVANAAHGNVTVNADGTYSYTPNANFNGTDSFTFKANDGTLDSNVASVSLTINAVNDPPVIVSDGGGDTASLSVPENTTAVTTVVATDIDSPTLTYSIVGGIDAGKFQINGSTGALSFIAAPDFENPTDADHNNSYIVQVRASDGSLSDDQLITVSVTDVSETVPKLHWMASVDAGAHVGAFGPTEAPIERWVPAGIADFNGDATSDLAWYNSFSNSIDIWKLSNGGFGSDAPTGSHPAGYQPAGFGDFNHDGTSDVLWFNPTTRDVDLWKISNGQWAGSVDIGTHPAGYAISGVGDFNNDGTSDVLWFNATTRDAEVWKISNGQWAGSVDIGTHPAGYQPALTGDFNGDGTSDVAWYNSSTGDVDIWKISNGQWAGSIDVGAHPAGWQPLGAADFNKDGTSDIAWYNPTTNDVDIWLIKNGQWAGSVDVGQHPAGSTAIGVGDFDHNGVSDVMWLNNNTGHIDNWLLAFS